MKKQAGTLYCIGVGPGDPELMTLKAQRLLTQCPVVASPVTGGEKTMALDIVKGAVSLAGKEILLLDFPMVSDAEILRQSHRRQAEEIARHLDAGKDVAFITIGDVSVYATLPYVSGLLADEGYAVAMIPGVTSFCACACVLGRSLTEMQLPLHIFPGSFTDVKDALSLDGTKVFMKSGRQIGNVKKALLEENVKAAAVVDCGLATQAVYPSLAELPEGTGYFTTIITEAKS